MAAVVTSTSSTTEEIVQPRARARANARRSAILAEVLEAVGWANVDAAIVALYVDIIELLISDETAEADEEADMDDDEVAEVSKE